MQNVMKNVSLTRHLFGMLIIKNIDVSSLCISLAYLDYWDPQDAFSSKQYNGSSTTNRTKKITKLDEMVFHLFAALLRKSSVYMVLVKFRLFRRWGPVLNEPALFSPRNVCGKLQKRWGDTKQRGTWVWRFACVALGRLNTRKSVLPASNSKLDAYLSTSLQVISIPGTNALIQYCFWKLNRWGC